MMKKTALWTKDFLLIAGGNFFVFLTFYILLVALPIYAINDLHSNNVKAGLLTTVFLFSAIIIRPFTGYWLERFGKKVILICALTIFGVSSGFYFVPDTMNGLLLLRLFHGIGFGMTTTAAGAIVADIIPDSRRGEGMGYFVLSSTIAMVLGPFIGLTVMNHWSTTIMFLICIVSTLFSLVFGLVINLPKQKNSLNTTSLQLKDLFESSAVPISIIGAIFAVVYSSVLSFVSVYANEIGLTNVSSFFFVVYAVVLLLSRPFTGKWFDLYGENWIIYPALICFGVGMYVLGVTSSAIIFILSAALIGIGWGTAFPSFQTIAIQYSPPKRRGLATATFLSIFDLGIGIGSFVVGLAINKVGFQVIYQSGSVFVIAGILIYYFMHGRKISKSKSTKKEVNSLSH